jgi:hypothetical protein
MEFLNGAFRPVRVLKLNGADRLSYGEARLS